MSSLDIKVLELVTALSDANNHELHVQAIHARDAALSASIESYGNLCVQLALLMQHCDNPAAMLEFLKKKDPSELTSWQHQVGSSAWEQLVQGDGQAWIQFGQLAGLVLKQALLVPPPLANQQQQHRVLHLAPPFSDQVKDILLSSGLACRSVELRSVVSSVIATTAVSHDSVQPSMAIAQWPQLLPTLIQNLQQNQDLHKMEASLETVRKMMEDGPSEIPPQHLDELVPLLIRFFQSPLEKHKVSALQAMVSCMEEGILPLELVATLDTYLGQLSALAADPSSQVRKWVCRSIVTLLVLRTEFIEPHMDSIGQFMLTSTADIAQEEVALEACEFWLTFTTLEDDGLTPSMVTVVQNVLPQLVPTLLRGMVYSTSQQEDLLFQNEVESSAKQPQQQVNKPVFHKTKNKHGNEEPDSDEDDNDFDDDDDNEWSLRKCCAASLDSLATMYGPDSILPAFLPTLKEGLSHTDVWVQEASVLALGAIADGCRMEMYPHMGQLYPFLLQILAGGDPNQQNAAEKNTTTLPQLQCIAAWTLGRYASWAVLQVQSGQQGHLLATMTEVLMARLEDSNRKVQVAACSAFGVLVESAGDLLVPYLEPIYRHMVSAMSRFQGKSLLVIFDTMGVLADFVGPAIGEGNLTSIYIPPLLRLWNDIANHMGPTDRTLLPLMESLASIALVCGVNFQPYALETFDMCMSIIEAVTLLLASSDDDYYIADDQEADPIVCASDLMDGLVEGLKTNFPALVSSSTRYGPHFGSVLHSLTKHEVPSVRMSAFALVGDLAVQCPVALEPALPLVLKEAIENLDTTHSGVCNNAVWAIGEVCVRCINNPKPLEPFAQELVQRIIGLLMGNALPDGLNGYSSVVGVTENAAAAMGRLAKVNANFVAPDLPRFLVGWCDGIAKVSDPKERHDGFEGFLLALHANPQAIQGTHANITDTVSAILFAIVSWHMPQDGNDTGHISQYTFQPFPPHEAELQQSLGKLMHEIKNSLNGQDTWSAIQNQMPVNVRRLLRETYQL